MNDWMLNAFQSNFTQRCKNSLSRLWNDNVHEVITLSIRIGAVSITIIWVFCIRVYWCIAKTNDVETSKWETCKSGTFWHVNCMQIIERNFSNFVWKNVYIFNSQNWIQMEISVNKFRFNYIETESNSDFFNSNFFRTIFGSFFNSTFEKQKHDLWLVCVTLKKT